MNKAITILKALAAILITVSHLDSSFPDSLRVLASGGALGDTLFFFCSGFTLFLGRDDGFYNWYKRRFTRIYPTVIVWAILTSVFLGWTWTLRDIVMTKGMWFLHTIMIYYVLLYLIRKFLSNHLTLVFLVSCVGVVAYSFAYGINRSGFVIYGCESFIKVLYFPWMLLGAIVGKASSNATARKSGWWWLPIAVMCLALWGGVVFATKKGVFDGIISVTLLGALPLMVAVFAIYRCCELLQVQAILKVKVVGPLVELVSLLTLEIYVCQPLVMGYGSRFFPLNIIGLFAYLIMAAYILKCATNAFNMLFKPSAFDWRAVFSVKKGKKK